MVTAILQARMSSTRLPGKVLRPIVGQPMLALQVQRILAARLIHKLVIATSTESEDDPISQLCSRLGVSCFRGSLHDVLDRFYRAMQQYPADTVVRLTGDCPLADPEVIDTAIRFYGAHTYDYASNTLQRTYPIGLDVEVISASALAEAWAAARLPSEREHVTPFLYKHPDRYTIGQFIRCPDMSHHRWTVDEPEDFAFVSRVYQALYPHNQTFSSTDIFALLERQPDLQQINYHIRHGTGYEESLKKDQACHKGAP